MRLVLPKAGDLEIKLAGLARSAILPGDADGPLASPHPRSQAEHFGNQPFQFPPHDDFSEIEILAQSSADLQEKGTSEDASALKPQRKQQFTSPEWVSVHKTRGPEPGVMPRGWGGGSLQRRQEYVPRHLCEKKWE